VTAIVKRARDALLDRAILEQAERSNVVER
jgi:hypothetical protein